MLMLGVLAQVREQDRDVARIVLPVAVDLHGDVIAVLERELIAGLHGAADPEVERVADDPRAAAAARRPVSSVEPSSTTTTSNSGACRRISLTVPAMAPASL